MGIEKNESVRSYLPVVSRQVSVCLALDEIMAIERHGRKIEVVTSKCEYYYYEKMDTVMSYLNEDFYPCLKGYVINLAKVKRIYDGKIVFQNGMTRELSVKTYCRTRQVFNAYIRNHRSLIRDDRSE